MELEKKYAEASGRDTTLNASPDGTICGWAAVYGNVDRGGDRFMSGAFTKDLAENGNVRPLCVDHQQSKSVGTVRLTEKPGGLWAEGTLVLELQDAKDVYTRIRSKLVRSFSVGYRTVRSRRVGGVRELQECQVFEVSAVLVPMNEAAEIVGVKSALGRGIARVRNRFLEAAGFRWEPNGANRFLDSVRRK